MKPFTTFFPGLLAALIWVAPLQAQTGSDAAVQSGAPAAAQAPYDMTQKITALVDAGKYAEAQQLTTGLLVAYPDDQRLIKAKALLENLLAHPGTPNAAPGNEQKQWSASTNATQLSGEDRVGYNALVERAQEAQQSSDFEQQKALLQKFMADSGSFLQKHPEQMLLWQIRAASAINLNDADAGYEAAQKLLAVGAADSNDANLQHLLGQLKNKGWLDKQGVEDFKKYDWILGTWSISWSVGEKADQQGRGGSEVFSRTAAGDIEGRYSVKNGRRNLRPNMRGTFRGSQVSWEEYLETSDNDSESPGGHTFVVDDVAGKQYYPFGWQPPISYLLSDDKRTMTMVFPQQSPKRNNKYASQHPVTLVFEKISDVQ
jgi:hypothetical protein